MAPLHRTDKPTIWLLVVANLLLPVALLTFATGFFPYKPFISGINQFQEADLQDRPDAPFDKVIFMVVDALRSDFVYSNNSGFSFVQSLIRSGDAVPFTGHAKSPTVTMPRIKALTTGSNPSFLDAILNLAESDTTSTLAHQDTWPLQLSLMKEGRINIFGDDTWIKLFPKLFSRKDGTTSFFVSDFTEVDNNVTRNVPGELERGDWNGMILHYLGLDHIGHKTGPNSPHMIPKQREMDNIVSLIYSKMLSETHLASTILVLCGDHGMNEAGNHGGSSPGETSTALVFISPKFKQISKGQPSPAPKPIDEFRYYNLVEQSDVVPTLAGLLGFPIPLNNLGIFIPDFLQFWSSGQDRQWFLQKNIAQMMGIVKPAFSGINFDVSTRDVDCEDPSGDAARLYCGYHSAIQSVHSDADAENKITQSYKFLRDVQGILSSVSSNYNMSQLVVGILLSLAAYSVAVVSFARATSSDRISPSSFSILIWGGIVQVLYGIMMFASSYVEEEQHFWYWISSAWMLWLHLSRYPSLRILTTSSTVTSLIISRITHRWNQTGQKFAGEPDIARVILLSHNHLLWALVAVTYLFIMAKSNWYSSSRLSQLAVYCSNFFTIYAAIAFKIAFTTADAPELLKDVPFAAEAQNLLKNYNLPYLARCVFLGVSFSIFLPLVLDRAMKARVRSVDVASYLHTLLTIILITQARLHNIPLLLLFSLQLFALRQMSLSPSEITLSVFLLQHASFFAYGGSNALSSIDLSNAYNGVTGYNALAVGLLTFVSNWVGPIWWSLGGIVLLLRNSKASNWQPYFKFSAMLTMMVASNLVYVQIACLMLRSHLFIWSVFSPKYLYMVVWTLGQHLGCNLLLSSIVYWTAISV